MAMVHTGLHTFPSHWPFHQDLRRISVFPSSSPSSNLVPKLGFQSEIG